MPNWGQVLQEIHDFAKEHPDQASSAHDTIRRRYLKRLHEHTDRNIIAYYSGFLTHPGIAQAGIIDEDKNGFMMAAHTMHDKTKGLDLILHTPGGNIAATHSIVNYLQKIFKHNIRAIIPQIAMSAGTMLACSCRSILMAKHSNLGPIDPHLRDIPTYGVLREFRRAHREVKKDPSKLFIWQTILSQYRPTFLGQCENAVKWSNDFVRRQLENVMFEKDPKAKQKADLIVKGLSNYQKNRVHDRHIHAEECEKIGLKVEAIENDQTYQDLLLTVHHHYMHIFMNSKTYKIIENHDGAAIFRNWTSPQPT